MSNAPNTLDERLNALPRAIEPPADLWPGITARIGPQRRSMRLENVAASLAIALMLVLVGKTVLHDNGAPLEVVPATQGPITSVSFSLPVAARYQSTRAAMESTFNERLKLLRPETRTTIEENLQIIRKANDDIRHALESDPSSPLLLQLLNETYQQEFDLYQNVARNTEPTQGRS